MHGLVAVVGWLVCLLFLWYAQLRVHPMHKVLKCAWTSEYVQVVYMCVGWFGCFCTC